jgi:hypothetical protein
MTSSTLHQTRLPGTMEGLLATTIEALTAVSDLDDAAAEVGALIARVERYLADGGGDAGMLLYDAHEAARMLDALRWRVAPLLRRSRVA